MTSFNISIQNMTCAGCAGRAERALNALGDTQAIVILLRIPRVWIQYWRLKSFNRLCRLQGIQQKLIKS